MTDTVRLSPAARAQINEAGLPSLASLDVRQIAMAADARILLEHGLPLIHRLQESIGVGPDVDDLVWLLPREVLRGVTELYGRPVEHADVTEPMLAHRGVIPGYAAKVREAKLAAPGS